MTDLISDEESKKEFELWRDKYCTYIDDASLLVNMHGEINAKKAWEHCLKILGPRIAEEAVRRERERVANAMRKSPRKLSSGSVILSPDEILAGKLEGE